MKMKTMLTFTAILICAHVYCQKINFISIELGFNQINLAYSRSVSSLPVYVGMEVGIANQDINNAFDDIVWNTKIGYFFLQKKKTALSVNLFGGVYVVENDYYKATTPVIGCGLDFSRFLGKKQKHSINLGVDFQYGKRDYREVFESEYVRVESIGSFSVIPVKISIGYSFRF